ncbi:MAG: hypothetical protein M3301_01560 [Chloroflexota bacterium]|nr:hypothetical protein [Chloroflexota bacterium]
MSGLCHRIALALAKPGFQFVMRVGLALLGRLFSCPTVHVLVTGNQNTALLLGLSPVAA